MANNNILSERYASRIMNEIFSRRGTISSERSLWLAVMIAQRELGLDIQSEDIEKYEKAHFDIDLNLIDALDADLRHDVKAKIQAYQQTAGAKGVLHMGMTSRDLTDNVEQMQIRDASRIIFGKQISLLRHFMDRAKDFDELKIVGRSHHQGAKPTLMGRRMTMWGEESYLHITPFETHIEEYHLRGIKGPVGTQADMVSLLGSQHAAHELEKKVAEFLNFEHVLHSPGQVYPRSMDYATIGHLTTIGAAMASFATTMRLMSGLEIATEGFKDGQVASTAMPHKMNPRTSERICGFMKLLRGYANIASMNAGDQWEEGDVSCSVVRRVIIPDAFYAADGMVEATLTVLNEMGVYPAAISDELRTYLPFVNSTQLLMHALDQGVGREKAHKAIQGHMVAAALARRNRTEYDLVGKIADDEVLGKPDAVKVQEILRFGQTGRAGSQMSNVQIKVGQYFSQFPAEAAYEPEVIR